MVDLSRSCDACGSMVGGGVEYCPRGQIYLCFICCYTQETSSKK